MASKSIKPLSSARALTSLKNELPNRWAEGPVVAGGGSIRPVFTQKGDRGQRTSEIVYVELAKIDEYLTGEGDPRRQRLTRVGTRSVRPV